MGKSVLRPVSRLVYIDVDDIDLGDLGACCMSVWPEILVSLRAVLSVCNETCRCCGVGGWLDI